MSLVDRDAVRANVSAAVEWDVSLVPGWTESNTWDDLKGLRGERVSGPSVVLSSRASKAIVAIDAYVVPPAGGDAWMGVRIDGETPQPAVDTRAMLVHHHGKVSAAFVVDGMHRGATVTALYRASGGRATFGQRKVTVMPLDAGTWWQWLVSWLRRAVRL